MPDFDTGSGRLVLGDSVAYVSPIFTPIDFDNRWTVWNLHIQLAAGSEGMTLTPEGVIRLNMQCSVKVSGQPAKPVYLSAPCLEGMFTSLNARVEGDALVHSISPTPTVAGAFVSKTSIHPRQLYVNPASIEYIDMEVLSYSGPSTGTLQLDIIDPKGQNSYMGTGTSLAGIPSFPHTIRVFGS